MLTRRKLLKAIIKSIFTDGWRSRLLVGNDSNKVSDETMSFESDGEIHVIRMIIYKPKGCE